MPIAIERNTVCNVDGWLLRPCPFLPITEFSCGDDDLDEYFREDAIEARDLMTCETFVLTHEKSSDAAVGLVSVCNDTMAMKDIRGLPELKGTPEAKLNYKDWPAVKIARLAVLRDVQGKNVGSHLMNLLKHLFVVENRTGCRIMTVDAYNKPEVIRFYVKNGFDFITAKDINRQTRGMWFDLLPCRNSFPPRVEEPATAPTQPD